MLKKIFFSIDGALFVFLIVILLVHYAGFIPPKIDSFLLALTAGLATLPVLISALRALKNKKISVDLLASIALVVSLIAKEWPSAVFINLMLASARLFGDYAGNRAKHAIQSLLKLKPRKAKVERNGKIIEIPLNEIKKGDLAIVDLGEQIPVDGSVYKGEASVDQSSLTGESVPVPKSKGDQVWSSTIVVSGNLIVSAEKIGKETMFEKIINLVEKSEENKAPITNVADKFASRYILLTILGATLLYFFSKNLSLVLAVLLVTCADDIAVALPLAFLSSIGYAAKQGAIVKGANFIEGLSKLKVLVVDKTGTLTRGKLKTEEVFSFNKTNPEEILEVAAAMSLFSNHPSARAILNYAKEKGINAKEPQEFNEISGKGTTAVYQNKKVITGKLEFLKEMKIEIFEEQLAKINAQKEKGLTVTLVGLNNRLAGFITLADALRPKIKEAIEELKNLGVGEVVMLTGDNEKIASRVSQQVGIRKFHANLLPEDKLRYLKKYLGGESKTAMVGDGVNDAAAITLADIGIAMGAIGSDAAIESADIALMRDDFSVLPEIVEVSKYTVKIAHQDLWIWGIVNAMGLIAVFTRILAPTGAAAFNFLTDFMPLINSLRVFGFHFTIPSKRRPR